MDVDQDEMRAAAQPVLAEFDVERTERVVERVHEQPAHDVDDHDLLPTRRLEQVGAPARRAGGKVDRPQQPLVLGDVGNDLALVPGMVAGGDAVDTGLVELGADLGGDAEARRRVLAVHDHEVEAELAPETRDLLDHRIAAGAADDVATEQNFHALDKG